MVSTYVVEGQFLGWLYSGQSVEVALATLQQGSTSAACCTMAQPMRDCTAMARRSRLNWTQTGNCELRPSLRQTSVGDQLRERQTVETTAQQVRFEQHPFVKI